MALSRGFIRNAGTTPLDARLMDQARLTQNADGSVRTGILGSPPTLVTATATTNPMTVNVVAAPIVASKGVGDGAVVYANDGTVAVTIPAAPGSNSRIDVIWTRHPDDTTGDASSAPIFGVTSGGAAASPTKPAIPTGAVELATLRIYAGTTATNGGSNTLTQTFQMTAASGGAVPFRALGASVSPAAGTLNAWTTAQPGQLAVIAVGTGDDGVYRFDGTAWLNVARAVSTHTWVAGGVGDNGTVGPTVPLTRVAAESSNDEFVTARTGLSVTVKRGLYVVTLTVSVGVNPITGRSFAQISKGGTLVSRNSPQNGEDTFATTATIYVESDGTVLAGVFYKMTGGGANMTGRFTVAKIG